MLTELIPGLGIMAHFFFLFSLKFEYLSVSVVLLFTKNTYFSFGYSLVTLLFYMMLGGAAVIGV